ncbi:hypothetical protein EI94DRAFT_1806215 [Lactarius quietus]|nr:hypothetical protein EI94DRAFT_1814325 [Lactarius quietus]KAF8264174.1 hypothetical protein EI94DRAFT_1806215 [Lactarius quietus]
MFWTLNSRMNLTGARDTRSLTFSRSISRAGDFDALTTFLSSRAEDDVLPVGQLQLEIYAREGRENFGYFSRC